MLKWVPRPQQTQNRICSKEPSSEPLWSPYRAHMEHKTTVRRSWNSVDFIKQGAGAGAGVGMLRGRGIPLVENKK